MAALAPRPAGRVAPTALRLKAWIRRSLVHHSRGRQRRVGYLRVGKVNAAPSDWRSVSMIALETEWERPWTAVQGIAELAMIQERLDWEINPQHPLHGRGATVVARRVATRSWFVLATGATSSAVSRGVSLDLWSPCESARTVIGWAPRDRQPRVADELSASF